MQQLCRAYKGGNFYDGANSIREIESPTSNTGSFSFILAPQLSNNDIPNYYAHVQGDFSLMTTAPQPEGTYSMGKDLLG